MKAQGLDALEKTVGAVFIAGVTVAEVRERLLARATQNGDPPRQQPSANPTSNHQHPPTISYATYAAEFYNGANAWFGTAEANGHHVALTSSNDEKTHTTLDAVGTHLRAPSQRPWLPPPLLPTHLHPMNYAPLPSHENARPTAEPVNLLPRAALMDFLGHAESAASTGLQHYYALQHHHALQQPSSWAASPAGHVPHGPGEAHRHGSPTCDLMFGHAKELYSLINHPTSTCASASTSSQPVLVPHAATATGTLGRAASLAMTARDKASVAKGASPAAPQWERGGTTPTAKASMPTAKVSRPRQRVNTTDAAPPVPGSSAGTLLTNPLPAAAEVAAAAAAAVTPAAATAVGEASATPTASPAAATPAAAEEPELDPEQSRPCLSDPCETDRLSPSCPAATAHQDYPGSAVCITQAPPSPPSPSAAPSPQQLPRAIAADAPLAAGSACTTSQALLTLAPLEVADEAATAAPAPGAAAAATASVLGSAALETTAATTVAGLDRVWRPGTGMEGWAAGGIRSDSLLLPCIAATPSTPPSAPHQLGACCFAAAKPAPLLLIAAGELPGLPPAAAGPDQAINPSPLPDAALDQTSLGGKPFAAEAADLVVNLHQARQSHACWAPGTPANVPAPAPTLAPAAAPLPPSAPATTPAPTSATALTSAPLPTPAPSPPLAPAPRPAPALSPLSPPAPPPAPGPPPAPAPAPPSAPAPPPAAASSPLSAPVPSPTPSPTPSPIPAPAPAPAPTPHAPSHSLQPPDLKVADWDQGPGSHLLRCHSHVELAPAGCMSPNSEPQLHSCQATPPPARAPPCLVQAKSMAAPAPGQGEAGGLAPTHHPSCYLTLTLTAAAALPPAKQAEPIAQPQPTAAVAVAQNPPRTQPEAQPSLPQPAAAPPAPPSPPNLHTQPAAVVLDLTAPAPALSKLLPSTSPFMTPAAQQATMRCASLPAHPCQPGPSDLPTCHQLLQPAAAAALTLSAISTEVAVGCTPTPRPHTPSTSPQHNHSPAPSPTSPPAGWALLPVRTSPPQPSLRSQSSRQCSTAQPLPQSSRQCSTAQPLPQSSRQCSAAQPQLQCSSRQSSASSSLASLPCLTATTSPGSAWLPRPHLPRHHPHSDPGLDSPRACCSQAPSSPPSCSLPSSQSPPRPVRQGRRASTTNNRYIGQLRHKPQPSAGPVPLPLPPLEVFQQQAWLCEQAKPSRWPSLVPAPGLTASLHLTPVPDTVRHCPKRAATLPSGLELPPENGCHLAPSAAAPQPTLSSCLPHPCLLTHLHSAPSLPSLRHIGPQHPHTQPALTLPAPASSPDRSSLPLRLTPSTVQELVMRLEAYAPCTSPGPAPPRLLVKSLSSSKSSRSCTQHFSVPKDPRWARSRTVSHQAWAEAERAQGHRQQWGGAMSSQVSVVHAAAGASPVRTPPSALESQACRPSVSPSSSSCSSSPAPAQGQLAKVDGKRSSHPVLGGVHSRSAAVSPRSPVALSRPAASSAGGSAGDSPVALRPVQAKTPPLRASSQTSIGEAGLCSTWPREAQRTLPPHPDDVSPVAQQQQGQQRQQGQQGQQQQGQQQQGQQQQGQQQEGQQQEGQQQVQQQQVQQQQCDGRQLVSSDEEAELALRLRQARLTRGSSESGLRRHPPALVSEVPCGMTARHWNALCRRSTMDGLPRSSSSSPSPLPPPPPPFGPGTLHPTPPCPPALPDPVATPLPSPGCPMQQGGCTALGPVVGLPGELLRSHPIAWDPCSDTSTSCRTSSPSDTPSPPPAASPVGQQGGSELPASLPAATTTATLKNGTRRIETVKAPAVAVVLAAAGVAAATAAPAAAGVATAVAAAAAAPVAGSIGDSAASGLVRGEPGSWPHSKTSTPHSACTTPPPASTSATHPVKAAVQKYFLFRRRSKPSAAAAQAPALSPPLPASQQAGLPLPPARSVTLPAHSRSHPRSLQPLQEGAVQGGKRTANLLVRGGSGSGEEQVGSCTSCMPFHRSWRP